MKRTLTCIILSMMLKLSIAQTKDIVSYSNGKMYMVVKDAKNILVSKKPMGKNVTVAVDTFFKSYTIEYIDENGESMAMKYTFFTLRGDIVEMKDTFGNQWALLDAIKKVGSLYILAEIRRDGLSYNFEVDELVHSN